MQVMCVTSPNKEVLTNMKVDGLIEVGSEYTVTSVWDEEVEVYYQLAGYPETYGFDAKLFARLPAQTADEINEQDPREAVIM